MNDLFGATFGGNCRKPDKYLSINAGEKSRNV